MKEKLKHYTKEIISFFLILFILSNVVSYYRSTNLSKQNLEKVNYTLLNNKDFTVDKNKPLLIHFWATWCPVCKLEAANIQAVSEEYQVLTIAVDSGSEKEIKEYLKDLNLNFQTVNDKTKDLATKYNIQVYPTTFIYDKNQNLVFSEVGYTSTLGLKLRMFWAGL